MGEDKIARKAGPVKNPVSLNRPISRGKDPEQRLRETG
jgi:hypothetical protein